MDPRSSFCWGQHQNPNQTLLTQQWKVILPPSNLKQISFHSSSLVLITKSNLSLKCGRLQILSVSSSWVGLMVQKMYHIFLRALNSSHLTDYTLPWLSLEVVSSLPCSQLSACTYINEKWVWSHFKYYWYFTHNAYRLYIIRKPYFFMSIQRRKMRKQKVERDGKGKWSGQKILPAIFICNLIY